MSIFRFSRFTRWLRSYAAPLAVTGGFSILAVAGTATVAPVQPAAAAVTNYAANPIPVVSGQQMGWAYSKTSAGLANTFSGSRNDVPTTFFCSGCWRRVIVSWLNGTSTTNYSYGSGNGVTTTARVTVGTNNVSRIYHAVKFKVGGVCYIDQYVRNNSGVLTSHTLTQQASC